MPIMLTRKDSPPTPFRNAEYIPFYYFIPKSILSRCGAELNAIPRNPQELFHNRDACEFVESDLFRLLIISTPRAKRKNIGFTRPARKRIETICGKMWNTACPLRPAQENLKISFMRSVIRSTLCAFRSRQSIGSVPCG